MCGVAGLIALGGVDREVSLRRTRRMLNVLQHRGPDANGLWEDTNTPVFLGHTRLAVVDLSVEGAQPMRSRSQRYVLSYNGEIYNHADLRAELDLQSQSKWRGHSDTEVLLEAVERWGIEGAVKKLNGMFAFALWDCEERQLWLGRDRCGEKPLYFRHAPSELMFASELRSITAACDNSPAISPAAVQAYFARNYVPAPLSIFQNVFKVEPATLMCFRVRDDTVLQPTVTNYWNLVDVADHSSSHRFTGSREEGLDELQSRLSKAVGMRMHADVPLGAFLSGGIDSSTIVALMQRQSSRPVKTFTIGSELSDIDESNFAREVARHLGTEHYELIVSGIEARSVVPRLPDIFDEPFADSSQIPTYLVSAMARKSVTVALSGDGGDEVFGGYHRHVWAPKVWRFCRTLPLGARRFASNTVRAISPSRWQKLFSAGTALGLSRHTMAGDRVHKLAGLMDAGSRQEVYTKLIGCWPDGELFEGMDAAWMHADRDPRGLARERDFEEWMMINDTLGYLPDDILVKVDRASMAVSLEARAPFLDHELIEFSWSLPREWKVNPDGGKLILRDLLHRLVPRSLVDRPKTGFGIPLADWLRNDLKEWMCDLVNRHTIEQHGLFRWAPIERAMVEHFSKRRNFAYQLWTVVMFQAWYERLRSNQSVMGGNDLHANSRRAVI
jgi:asparagine synthase (glutamine-hydrolysing)